MTVICLSVSKTLGSELVSAFLLVSATTSSMWEVLTGL